MSLGRALRVMSIPWSSNAGIRAVPRAVSPPQSRSSDLDDDDSKGSARVASEKSPSKAAGKTLSAHWVCVPVTAAAALCQDSVLVPPPCHPQGPQGHGDRGVQTKPLLSGGQEPQGRLWQLPELCWLLPLPKPLCCPVN